jgi:IS605 OrfB family transposase
LLSAGGEWRFSAPLKVQGRLKRLSDKLDLAPSLIVKGGKISLSCPVEFNRPKYITNADFKKSKGRLCAVDVGINTAATATIVTTDGTVIARKFLTCGRHNDRRDRIADQIAAKQAETGVLKKGQRFCLDLFSRSEGLGLDAARRLASDLLSFAREHGARAFAVEDLKGWKPKGRGARLKQKFHRWEHRRLIASLKLKAEEFGLRVMEVFARGTSRWAYDGSGKVKRDKANYSLATFSNGKQYNADLNAAYNIAARGLARLLSIDIKKVVAGRSPGATERMPLVLADVWAWARNHATGSDLSRAI